MHFVLIHCRMYELILLTSHHVYESELQIHACYSSQYARAPARATARRRRSGGYVPRTHTDVVEAQRRTGTIGSRSTSALRGSEYIVLVSSVY
eukprot:COSAG02_NODE_3469_length_6691_cov_9.305218_6_plen_93_part_00